jgi:magnesium transporter
MLGEIKENLEKLNIKKLIKKKDYKSIADLLSKKHSEDIIEFLNQYSFEIFYSIFNNFSVEKKSSIISKTNKFYHKELINKITLEEMVILLNKIPSNIAADIISLYTRNKQLKILEMLEPNKSKKVKELIVHPAETAGGIMIKNFITAHESTSVQEAIELIRKQTDEHTSLFVFTVDAENRLLGYIPIHKLIKSPPDLEIGKIATKKLVSVFVEEDREVAAQLIKKYNLFGLPVLDDDKRLVGVIKLDDALKVLAEENTEDMYKIVGTTPDEMLSNSIFKIVKIRFFWLFVCWLGGIFALQIIHQFEDTLNQVVALAAFIPVIMGMGGNIGSQSLTIVVRGIATGAIQFRDLGRVFWKESRVALTLGLLYGIMLGIVSMFQYRESLAEFVLLPVVVAGGITISMLVAAILGTLIPLFLKKVNIDPAVATGPLVTTSIDVIGLVAYFLLAKLLLF